MQNSSVYENNPVTDLKYKEKKQKFIFITIIVVTILITALLILLLTNNINNAIYAERQQSLGDLTAASAQTVNESIETEWNLARLFSGIVAEDLPSANSIESFTNTVNKRYDFDGDKWFLVDEEGKYYCSDGCEGRIQDRTYYTSDTERELEYLSTLPHMDQNVTYLIFRTRLDKPVTAKLNGKDKRIVYCALMHDLTELNKTVSSLFAGANNTFIYDSSGAMLYKQFNIGLLISGYNIFPKFSQADLVNGEDPEEMVQKCKNREVLVVEMEINGKRYYATSAPLNVSDWSLFFVIQKDYVASNSQKGFTSVILSLALIMILLMAAVILSCLFLYNAQLLREKSRRMEFIANQREALQKALDMAESANRAKTTFLNSMSHDIRTPMNAIIGFNDRARKHATDPEVIAYLNKVGMASEHLLSLINDVLDMSRIESGNVSLNEKPENLMDIILNMKNIMDSAAAAKNLKFDVDYSGIKDDSVYTDKLRLSQILLNLLSNAIKYTETGSVFFKITQYPTGSEGYAVYEFRVKDSGCGMSEEFLKTIFEPFTREKTSTISGIQGTGLGLAITKNIVDMMGGIINVESHPGLGSEFIVSLTFRISAHVQHETEAEAADTLPDFAGNRILLVEDNELNREIASEILEDVGFAVEEAVDGKEAVEKISASAPGYYNLVLMDIQMPVMDGYEASRAIRALENNELASIPIVAMTANAFEEDRQAAIDAGMNDHLAKPINIEKLYEVLRIVLKQN